MERKPKQPTPAPWLKLPGESAKAYEAFARFRDLRGARSFTAVARIFHCSKQNVARWGTRWKWQERCLAYDRHLDAMQVEELMAKRRAERRAMQSRQLRHTICVQRIALRYLKRVRRREKAGVPLNLSVAQMLKFIEVGAKLEREARGGEDAPPEFQDINVIFEGADQAELSEVQS